MKVIGISGKLRTGKTALAGHMLEMLEGNWKRIAYGDVLKQEVSCTYGVPLEWCYENKDESWLMPDGRTLTVREILQWYGTDYKRKEEPGYWVEKMADTIAKHRDLDGIIIDDVRFPDEADLVKSFDGLLIRLNPYLDWKCEYGIANHVSETALDGYEGFDFNCHPFYGGLRDVAEHILCKIVNHPGICHTETVSLWRENREPSGYLSHGNRFLLTGVF